MWNQIRSPSINILALRLDFKLQPYVTLIEITTQQQFFVKINIFLLIIFNDLILDKDKQTHNIILQIRLTVFRDGFCFCAYRVANVSQTLERTLSHSP